MVFFQQLDIQGVVWVAVCIPRSNLCVGDTPMTCISHRLHVSHQSALSNFEGWGLPCFPPTGHLLWRNVKLDRVRDRIDGYRVAIFN